MIDKVNITWRNVDISAENNQIVTNSTGYCEAGTMLAIMGASGSGKTTLLSAIAGQRLKGVSRSGQIMANNTEYSRAKQFYGFGSFVRQNDILYENLTARQIITFTALLKTGSPEEALSRTQRLLQKFELSKCSDAKIGGKYLKKGISGGEKKRLCIAVEMLNNSRVLVLDEPTSGLDSDKALKVLKVLNNLAKEGTTIILSIHQPSYRIFQAIDRFLILSKGQTVFQGQRSEMGPYMKKLGVEYSLTSTLSDSFMFEISDYKAKSQKTMTPITPANYQMMQGAKVSQKIEELSSGTDVMLLNDQGSLNKPFSEQFKILLSRETTLFFRSLLRFGRVILNAVISFLMIGLVFLFKISEDRPSEGAEYPYRQLVNPIMHIPKCSKRDCEPDVHHFDGNPREIDVYAKESISKTYSPLSYYMSKLIIEIPMLLTGTLVYSCGGYWLNGFSHTASQFFTFCVIMMMLAVMGSSLGMFIGMLFLQESKVAVMLPIIMVPTMLFSGIFNKLNDITPVLRWLQYLSPYRYGVHLLLQNEYGSEVYHVVGGFHYDYRKDLGISLSLGQGLLVCGGVSILFFIISFFLLKTVNRRLLVV